MSSVKRVIFSCIMVCVLILYAAPVYAFEVNARGAVLIDSSSGKVVFEQNAHERLYPASTTKIVTALLVLEHMQLTDTIIVPDDFVNPGEAGIWLSPGEEHTVEDLMYAMLLRSANDAALLLAIGTVGSEADFVKMMNDKVAELGLEDTHFVNPHGLHDDEHYTTAYDLAMLAREACKNEIFNEIIVTPRHQLPWVVGEYDRVVYNRNTLLDKYEYADGIKNGYTKQAGSCLVSSATKNDIRLIGVVLNCSQMYNESQAMLEYGFENCTEVSVCTAGDEFGSIDVDFGMDDSVPVIASASLDMLLTFGATLDDVETKVDLADKVASPIEKGQKLGTVTYIDPSGLEVSSDLVAAASVERRHTFAELFAMAWRAICRLFV